MYDRYNDVFRFVPLNGDIAGLCARTDLTNDTWFSPAGFNRGIVRGAVKLAFNPIKLQRDVLYPARINPVVTFLVKEPYYLEIKQAYHHQVLLIE